MSPRAGGRTNRAKRSIEEGRRPTEASWERRWEASEERKRRIRERKDWPGVGWFVRGPADQKDGTCDTIKWFALNSSVSLASGTSLKEHKH